MKLKMIAFLVLCMLFSVKSFATCSELDGVSKLTGSEINLAFNNQIVCALVSPGSTAEGPWHEKHKSDGKIDEMHSDTPADPIEPNVGTWAIFGDNITYTYNGGFQISYQIYHNKLNSQAPYFFCNGVNEVANATINTCP